MPFDALFQGLNAFKQGVQEYTTSKAIGQATDAVHQLKLQGLSDQEQRVATMQLGNDLALKLNQLGAPISRIDSAKQAVQPKAYGSAADAYLEGSLTGNKGLIDQAKQLQGFQGAPDVAKAKEQHAFEMEKLREQYRLMNDLQDTKNAGKPAKIKALATSEVKDIIDLDDGITTASDLLARVDKDPSIVGLISGRAPGRSLYPDKAAFDADLGRFRAAYRKATTGTGMSNEERTELGQNLPNAEDTVPVYLEKSKNFLRITQGRKERYIDTMDKAGRDVSRFKSVSGNTAAAGESLAPGEMFGYAPDPKTGQEVKVVVGSDGKTILRRAK
jgi:hypothetical protein